MPLKVNFTVPNKAIHAFIGLAVIAVLAAGAYAWVVANPPLAVPDPGHALDTIQGYFVGDTSLRATLAKLQQTLSGDCAGEVLVGINPNGTVVCETDNVGSGFTECQTNSNGSSSASASVSCSSGWTMVGGGCWCAAAGDYSIRRSIPNGNGWDCTCSYTDNPSTSAYVRCCRP